MLRSRPRYQRTAAHISTDGIRPMRSAAVTERVTRPESAVKPLKDAHGAVLLRVGGKKQLQRPVEELGQGGEQERNDDRKRNDAQERVPVGELVIAWFRCSHPDVLP